MILCAVISARLRAAPPNPLFIEEHVTRGRGYAAGLGDEVTRICSDIAITTCCVEPRVEYHRMHPDAADLRFDAIFTDTIDRLARRTAEAKSLHDRLAGLGVRLFTAQGGEFGAMRVGIMIMVERQQYFWGPLAKADRF